MRSAIDSDGSFTSNIMRHSLMSYMLTDLKNFLKIF
jgi:hypothetical protein